MTDQNEFELEVTHSAHGATMSVALRGEVNRASGERLCEVCTAAHEWLGVRRMVADLNGVEFMDSLGISALIECRNNLHRLGVQFAVTGARDGALRVLEPTGVLSLLSWPPDDTEQPLRV